MKKISIIIPVYNVEKYLKKCLDSVIKQSYKNLEIIMVDDGSTDNSLNICLDYQKKDFRIKVIHQENKGLSAARNRGFEESTGEYIWFIDSDDFIEENSIEVIKPYLDKYDIIVFNYTEVRKDKVIKMNDTKEYDNVNQKYMLSYVIAWNKIYKRYILDGEKFPEGYIYEDVYLMPTLGLKTNKIVFIDEFLYNHVYRENSIINSGFKLDDKLYALKHLDEKLAYNYKDELELIYIHNLLIACLMDKTTNYHLYNEINVVMKDKFPNYYNNKYWVRQGFLKKIFLYCFYKKLYFIPNMLLYVKININKLKEKEN